MIVLGLAGRAGVGKDTVADYLVERYGFVKFAFSDALYIEVQTAFGLPDDTLLRDRATKEEPSPLLALEHCTDPEFVGVMQEEIRTRAMWGAGMPDQYTDETLPLSPRWVLQTWGTEYRRAQNPQYWTERADAWIHTLWSMFQYPEHRPQCFVNTTVRYPNEQAFIHKFTNGNVWHLRRDGIAAVNPHSSEQPLPVLPYERELWNNDSVERLYKGVDLLLSTQAEFVRVEPMEPDELPASDPVAARIQ